MKRRWIVVALVLLLTAALAYVLRDFISEKVVLPLAYFWWKVGQVYHLLPEYSWWSIVVVIVFFAVLRSFNTEDWSRERGSEDIPPDRGPVEEMLVWLLKRSSGIYFRWLVANHLAKLARGYLIQTDGRDARQWDVLYKGPGWNPPDAVAAYLRSGLNRPTASFRSQSAVWGRSQMTTIDLDPEQAVSYLESQMENDSDGNQ